MRSFAARRVVDILHFVTRQLWGFEPLLMPFVVERLGPAHTLAWFARNMPRYEATLKRFGPVRTHLLCTELSLLNGCPYCVHGHGYALQLVYLAAEGRLFPLDEWELVALAGEPPDVVTERFERAVTDAGLPGELPWLQKMRGLREGTAPADDAERRIAHLLSMFQVLNACGIEGRVPPDEAHSPVNRDAQLRRRYAELRRAGGSHDACQA